MNSLRSRVFFALSATALCWPAVAQTPVPITFNTPKILNPNPIYNLGGSSTGSLNQEIPGTVLHDAGNNRFDLWHYTLGASTTNPIYGGDVVYHSFSTDGGLNWSTPAQIIGPTKRLHSGAYDSGLDWPECGVGIFAVVGGAFTFQGHSWAYVGFGEGGDYPTQSPYYRKNFNTIGAYFLDSNGSTLIEAESASVVNPVILPYKYNLISPPHTYYGAGLPHLIYIPSTARYRLYFFDDTYDGSAATWYVEFVADSNSARGFTFVSPTIPSGEILYTGSSDGIPRARVASNTLFDADIALIENPEDGYSQHFYAVKSGDSGGSVFADVHDIYSSPDGYNWSKIHSTTISTYNSGYPARLGAVWAKNRLGSIKQFPVRVVADYATSYPAPGSFGATRINWSSVTGDSALFDFETNDSRVTLAYYNVSPSSIYYHNPAALDGDGLITWDCKRNSTSNDGVADVYLDLGSADLSAYQSVKIKWYAYQDDGSNNPGSGGNSSRLELWAIVGANSDWVQLSTQTTSQLTLSTLTGSLSTLTTTQKQNVRNLVLRASEADVTSSNLGAFQRLHVYHVRLKY